MLKPIKPATILKTVKAAICALEKKRYDEKVVRAFEIKTNSLDFSDQIYNCFTGVIPEHMEILNYMAQNCVHDIYLSDVANKYHFSSAYLSRLIKKVTGYSFTELLNAFKLLRFLQYLMEDNEKINVICEKTGFYDPRYFSQLFKKVFDCSPSEFRKCRSSDKRIYSLKGILDLIDGKI